MPAAMYANGNCSLPKNLINSELAGVNRTHPQVREKTNGETTSRKY